MIQQKTKKIYGLPFFALFCIAVFACIFALPKTTAQANSQINLMISPEIFELQIEKGEIYNGKVKIYNKGKAPIPMEAVTSNFGAEEISGAPTFYNNSSGNNEEDDILFNPRKWMEIENPNFILDSGETVSIRFTISVPENAEDGGYYTVIFFEPKVSASGNLYQNESGVSVIPKIGALLLISVGERKKPTDASFLTVSEFSIPEKFHLKKLEDSVINITGLVSTAYAETIKSFSVVETSHLQFNLHIKNNDAYHIKPSGKLAILSNNGKLLGETEIRKTTILPGRTRQIPVEFNPELPAIVQKLPSPLSNFISKNLFFGKYHASLILDVDGISKKEDLIFWIFPWKFFLAIIFMLAVLILTRKRIKRAMIVLVRRK